MCGEQEKEKDHDHEQDHDAAADNGKGLVRIVVVLPLGALLLKPREHLIQVSAAVEEALLGVL